MTVLILTAKPVATIQSLTLLLNDGTRPLQTSDVGVVWET